MRIEYDLKVESEYHIGSGLSRPGVVDETIVKRPNGELFIPAEHLRGLVRDCCTQILYWVGKHSGCCEASLRKAPTENETTGLLTTCGLNFSIGGEPCVLCRIFGTTFTQKLYRFSDAVLSQEGASTRISTHNRIDPATGRVPHDLLFSFELGSPAIFKGYIERLSPVTNSYSFLEEVGLLIAGLRLIERVGKRSARGWGWACVEEIRLSFSDSEKNNLPPQVQDSPEDWRRWLKAFLGSDCGGGEGNGMGVPKG